MTELNRAHLSELISEINDSISVIKGSAQIAQQVDRPKWVDRYLRMIDSEVDRIDQLFIKVTDLCVSECYSSQVLSGSSKYLKGF